MIVALLLLAQMRFTGVRLTQAVETTPSFPSAVSQIAPDTLRIGVGATMAWAVPPHMQPPAPGPVAASFSLRVKPGVNGDIYIVYAAPGSCRQSHAPIAWSCHFECPAKDCSFFNEFTGSMSIAPSGVGTANVNILTPGGARDADVIDDESGGDYSIGSNPRWLPNAWILTEHWSIANGLLTRICGGSFGLPIIFRL